MKNRLVEFQDNRVHGEIRAHLELPPNWQLFNLGLSFGCGLILSGLLVGFVFVLLSIAGVFTLLQAMVG